MNSSHKTKQKFKSKLVGYQVAYSRAGEYFQYISDDILQKKIALELA